jgi:DNA-binding transcriptional LysR family regulator
MPIETWDEIRTAYQVARRGTVSGAAEALGVHHATVIRHIDALEGRLGVKLFQRHARGYTATEAGLDLLQVAQATADQFDQLEGRLHGRSAKVTGELVVTSLEVLSPLIAPVLAKVRAQYPEVSIKFLTDTRLFRLEYGEAHVAIRAGQPPEDPDNVVQKLFDQEMSLYATRAYVKAHGKIGAEMALDGHVFVGTVDESPRARFLVWLKQAVPEAQVIYKVSDMRSGYDAVEAGIGAGFVPVWRGDAHPDLVQLCPPLPDWTSPIWLVTHVDLHRTAKVQSVTSALKSAARGWGRG